MPKPDLFGFVKPRAPRRFLAHWTDVGDHGCKYRPGNTCVALFECQRCGWESSWIERRNKTHVLQGIPCENCNESRVNDKNTD